MTADDPTHTHPPGDHPGTHTHHPPDDATRTAASVGEVVHAIVLRFDQAWRDGHIPDLLAFLPPDGPEREAAFCELVAIDEERRKAAGLPLRTDAYRDAVAAATADHADAPSALPNAPLIPGYEVGDELGRGAMGVVYRARDVRLNRPAALKMILGGEHADPRRTVRFLVEAEAVAAVRHPHVVQVYEFGEADGRPFLALEYLPGGTLSVRLGAAQPPRAAAELLAKIACGVAAAHAQGIVHRDLKPGNVLFDADGQPKVTDFGLAKRGSSSDLTATEAVLGTPAYMSPEQAKGETKFVGPQADVWALGVILYECLTGKRPFDAANPVALMRKVAEGSAESPRKLVTSLPRDLELVCLKCLGREPHERYPTAKELGDDLDRFLRGEAISVRPARLPERAVKWVRRNKVVAASLAAVATALIAGTAVATWYAVAAAEAAREAKAAADREAEQRKLAEERAAEVARQKAEAERAFREVERNRARSYLRTIGHNPVPDQLDQAELVALDSLAQHESDRIKLLVLEEALADPETAWRVAIRCDRFAQAVVGLSPTRRGNALNYLTDRLAIQGLDPRSRVCAGLLALTLGHDDLDLLQRTASEINALGKGNTSGVLLQRLRRLSRQRIEWIANDVMFEYTFGKITFPISDWTSRALDDLQVIRSGGPDVALAHANLVRLAVGRTSEAAPSIAKELFDELSSRLPASWVNPRVFDCWAEVLDILPARERKKHLELGMSWIQSSMRNREDRMVNRDSYSLTLLTRTERNILSRRVADLIIRSEDSVRVLVDLLRDPGCVEVFQDAILCRLDEIAFPRPEFPTTLVLFARPFAPFITYATVADLNIALRDRTRRFRTVADAAEWLAKHHPEIDLDAPFRPMPQVPERKP